MMIDDLRIALELVEYKVEDLRRGRPVRGGEASIRDLLGRLEAHVDRLDPDEARRVRAAKAELGDGDAPADAPPAAPATGFDELVFGEDADAGTDAGGAVATEVRDDWFASDENADDDALLAPAHRHEPATPAEGREQEALHRLALRVFGRDVQRFSDGVAATWRAERERATARLMFATVRNLDRYREDPEFVNDVDLRRFRVVEPVPPRIDPLLSLSDTGSLSVIATDVVEAVLRLRDGDPAPRIRRRDSLDYLRRLALAVARDPWAGGLSAVTSRSPSISDLRAALRDLARERLPDWQRQARRQDLEERLRERTETERQQRSMLRRDTVRFAGLVDAFFERLDRLLPRSVGGSAEEPQLGGGILFAVTPALRRADVPPDARAVSLRLAGPVRFAFAGFDLAITIEGSERHLFVADREIPLDGDRVVPFRDHELESFVEGDYLHLRVRETGGSLAARTAEAAVALHVLAGPDRERHLEVMRLLAPGAPAEPTALSVEALRRAGQVTAKAPNRREALRRLLEGTARAVGWDPPDGWLQGFVARAQLALSARPEQLEDSLAMLVSADTAAGPPAVATFGGDPVDLTVGGRIITIRRYGQRSGHLVAMLPGRVIGAFQDHLIEALGDGTLVCVHAQQQLVVAYLPGTSIAAPARA